MKLQYCSDLHFEFPENKKYILDNPIPQVGDILILAGDIVPFAVMDKHQDFFDYVADHFKTTYWIPGNHEYYYYESSDKFGTIDIKIRENVFLVNNIVKEKENVKLLFSTLWSSIPPDKQWLIQNCRFRMRFHKAFRFKINFSTGRNDFIMCGSGWSSNHIRWNERSQIHFDLTGHSVDSCHKWSKQTGSQFPSDVELKTGKQFRLTINHISQTTHTGGISLDNFYHLLRQTAYHSPIAEFKSKPLNAVLKTFPAFPALPNSEPFSRVL